MQLVVLRNSIGNIEIKVFDKPLLIFILFCVGVAGA